MGRAILPMLATGGRAPEGHGWAVEPKLDGWRTIVTIADGSVEIRTRSGRNVSDRLPEMSPIRDIGIDVVLDGELVARQQAGLRRGQRPLKTRRPSSTAPSVTRKVDSSGNACFTGTNYYASTKYIRRQIQVAVVGETVELFIGEQLIRTHPIRHDRTREHGALANPGGRPRRTNAA